MKNKGLLFIIPLLLIGTCCYMLNKKDQQQYFTEPRVGDIYVFSLDLKYHPHKLIQISEEALYFYKPNYSFRNFKPSDISAYKNNPVLFSSDTVQMLRKEVEKKYGSLIGDGLTHIGR